MFTGFLKVVVFGVGISPTLISLLLAGVMLGRPQPCQSAPCVQKPYGGEVLILPFGTLLSMACGYLIGKAGSTRKTKEPEPSRALTVLGTYSGEGSSDAS